jgi:hypothetical protein
VQRATRGDPGGQERRTQYEHCGAAEHDGIERTGSEEQRLHGACAGEGENDAGYDAGSASASENIQIRSLNDCPGASTVGRPSRASLAGFNNR